MKVAKTIRLPKKSENIRLFCCSCHWRLTLLGILILMAGWQEKLGNCAEKWGDQHSWTILYQQNHVLLWENCFGKLHFHDFQVIAFSFSGHVRNSGISKYCLNTRSVCILVAESLFTHLVQQWHIISRFNIFWQMACGEGANLYM